MSVSRWYQSHPNNHSTEEPRFIGLPIRGQSSYPLRYTGSLWYSPFSKNVAPRCEQIYFILSFLKSQKTLKPQNVAAHKTTESCSHMTQSVPTHQRCQLYNHSHSRVSSNRLRWVSIRLPHQNLPYNRSDHFQIYYRITYFV